MPTLVKATTRLIIWLAVAAACLLLLLFAAGLRERRRAKAFLKNVQELGLGQATFDDAEMLARRYGGKPWNATPQNMTCTPEECYVHFEFLNPRNHFPFVFVPRVAFNGIVHVTSGRIVEVELTYQIDSHGRGPAAYELIYTLQKQPLSPYLRAKEISPGYSVAKLKVDKYGVPWRVEVRLNAESTATERERAFALNLSCLARLYGCTNPSAVVPPAVE